MQIESCKVAEAEVFIDLTPGELNGVHLQMKEGQVCLSIAGVLLGEGGTWYELPVSDIRSVDIIDGEPFKLRFVLEEVEVIIKGNNPHSLRALRHFLLPFLANN